MSQKILSDGSHRAWGRTLVLKLSRTREKLLIIGIFPFIEWEKLNLC